MLAVYLGEVVYIDGHSTKLILSYHTTQMRFKYFCSVKGRVLKSVGSSYTVLTGYGQRIESRIKGKLRIEGFKSTNPLAVGDMVEFVVEPDGTGSISAVHERKNCVIRKSKNLSKQSHILAANLDQALILVTPASPRTSYGFIDRYLATAEAYGIPAALIFNKSDLLVDNSENTEWVDESMRLYHAIGYPCYKVSSLNMNDEVRSRMQELLKDKTSLIAGHSGVGKSTFINQLAPELNLRTNQISGVHDKGMHTTTFTEMFPLEFGGFVIDSPGIKEFGLVNMEKHEVAHYFPEIFKVSQNCKFNTCLHLTEPKCAVREALSNGVIAESRFHSYKSILNGDEVLRDYED